MRTGQPDFHVGNIAIKLVQDVGSSTSTVQREGNVIKSL